jgi:hypothetical protein
MRISLGNVRAIGWGWRELAGRGGDRETERERGARGNARTKLPKRKRKARSILRLFNSGLPPSRPPEGLRVLGGQCRHFLDARYTASRVTSDSIAGRCFYAPRLALSKQGACGSFSPTRYLTLIFGYFAISKNALIRQRNSIVSYAPTLMANSK